jgi:hypothetical protein
MWIMSRWIEKTVHQQIFRGPGMARPRVERVGA